jgi:hypothetical protein
MLDYKGPLSCGTRLAWPRLRGLDETAYRTCESAVNGARAPSVVKFQTVIRQCFRYEKKAGQSVGP